jgi:hypothetical protein
VDGDGRTYIARSSDSDRGRCGKHVNYCTVLCCVVVVGDGWLVG